MKIHISYVHAGVAGKVTTLPADFIRWERHTKQKFSDLWQGENLRIGLEDLAVLTWAALARQGTQVPFDIWVDSLDSIDDFSDDDTDPTQPEAFSGSV
jgi:hypothetical protein